jgi:N-acetylglucosaminyldiphosphoundecaprenol N-acetyl-beta-D-mannosaminyltransferase
MPLVWMLRLMGHRLEDRVYGPTLTLLVLEAAARRGVPVGFFGGAPDVLEALVHKMGQRFPGLKIAYRHSPPFRDFTREEDEQVARDINASGARILFVGLGCPKQERWMAAQRGRVRCGHARRGGGFRFSCRNAAACAPVDAGQGAGVVVPPQRRTPKALGAIL